MPYDPNVAIVPSFPDFDPTNILRDALATAYHQAVSGAAPAPNDRFAFFVAYFLADHHLSRGTIESTRDLRARHIPTDDVPNVDRLALYILLTWKETYSNGNMVSVSSVVKYWTEDEDEVERDRLALIIHYHPVVDSEGGVVSDEWYQWFSYQNTSHIPEDKSLKDLLVVGKAVEWVLPIGRPVQLILFHKE